MIVDARRTFYQMNALNRKYATFRNCEIFRFCCGPGVVCRSTQACVHKRFSFVFASSSHSIVVYIVLCFMSIVIVIVCGCCCDFFVVFFVVLFAFALRVHYLFLFSITKASCFFQLGWSEFCEMLNELTVGPIAIVLTIKFSVRYVCVCVRARTLLAPCLSNKLNDARRVFHEKQFEFIDRICESICSSNLYNEIATDRSIDAWIKIIKSGFGNSTSIAEDGDF